MAKTPAQRMREYRARIAAAKEPETVKAALLAAYRRGYGDALGGRAPMPPAGLNEALAYLAGGLDAVP